jgi:hypothetical protein
MFAAHMECLPGGLVVMLVKVLVCCLVHAHGSGAYSWYSVPVHRTVSMFTVSMLYALDGMSLKARPNDDIAAVSCH